MTLSAQQYLGMRALFRSALAANSFLVANPSDGEVLSFFNQLVTEASGASALPAAQQAAVGYAFRGLLSGNFPGVSNPSDADVLAFWTQLSTDSSGAAALTSQRYKTLKETLCDQVSRNYPGAANPSLKDLLGYIAAVAIVTTPLTIITSSPPKLWVDSQLGTSSTAWTDQTANGNNFAEPTNPPTLTTLGGVPCYVGDGVAQRFRNATFTVTTGQWYWMIVRPISWVFDASLCGGATSARGTVFSTGSSPEVSLFSGSTAAPNSAGVPGSWYRYKFLCAGAASYLRIGSTQTTGNDGGTGETGWDIFCRAGIKFGNYGIAAIVACPAEPTAPEQAALDAYGASRWPTVSF